MRLNEAINTQWLDAESLSERYSSAAPFPHIVMKDFIREDLLTDVAREFPDLSAQDEGKLEFNDFQQIKFASKGTNSLSPSMVRLCTYLQSDSFLKWLNTLTLIEEPLISDPYLSGGGYHEIKRDGLLKVHADFNKHPLLDLDRRLNLLVYLNEDWDKAWGGNLQLFNEDMTGPVQSIAPEFNTAVIFTTTSFTYHGHPDPLKCPSDVSRRSLAYYYFSTGRPTSEIAEEKHSTLFKERKDEAFLPRGFKSRVKRVAEDVTPPMLMRSIRKILP